jgi:predicted  nucleic acid-binding Zn-ribbon protein
MEPDFVDAFNSGHRLYSLRSSVSSANYQIAAKRAELESAEVRSTEAGLGLIAGETTTQDRILLLAELKDLAERTGHLEAEILELVEDRAIYEQQLAAYEETIANVSY